MIVVAGEALVDLVIQPDGSVSAALGGAPFNTARACGRLGADVAFAGAVATDRFGSLLLAQLAADGVAVDLVERCDEPTTLAVAELDERGAASYRFYLDGTSAPSFTGTVESVGSDAHWLFTGGLALALEPMATTVARIVGAAPASSAVMVDLNVRPAVVGENAIFEQHLPAVLARADVVKASDEDLRYLHPDVTPGEAARRVLAAGARVVLLTAGGESVGVITGEGEAAVAVPPVDVVDTIGAGDTFSAGFLSWWTATDRDACDLDSIELLVQAVEAAVAAAAVVCTRRGADPPWRHELPPGWGA